MRSLILLTLTMAGAMHAQEVAGDWQGTLKVANGDLRLVLHVSKGEGGGITAVLDSPEQDAFGIPVSDISFENSTLIFNSEAIHGSYTGKLSADSITGMWTQGLSTPLEFKRLSVTRAPKPSELDGVWLGAIDLGTAKLRVAFHVFSSSDGLKATMDSLDQNAKGIPITSVTRSGATFKMEVAPIQGSYEGTLDEALTTISGTWKQGGGSYPLVLKRVKDTAELEVRRPQNPVKPYPYREEDVSYENKTAGIKLAATITHPSASGPYPAVLLIPGSGPHDRNEGLMGHKPFLVLADFLTRKGIVVLRADKRGIGESAGDGNTATTLDYASDAEAGVAFLKSRPEVDPHRIGLIGHSEGGIVAPIVASRDSDVAFVVMLAGSGVPGDELLVEQSRALALSMGQTNDDAEKTAAYEREILDLIKTTKDDAVLRDKLGGKVQGSNPVIDVALVPILA